MTSTPNASPLPRGLVVLLGGGGIVLTVAGIRALPTLIGSVFLALMLVIAVAPLQRLLIRRGAPKWLGTLAILVVLYALVLGLAVLMSVSVARLVAILPNYAAQAQELLASVTRLLQRFGVDAHQAAQLADKIEPSQVLNAVGGVVGGVAGTLSNVLLPILLILFMALDSADFPRRFEVVTAERPEIARALSSFAHGTRKYLVVSTIFGVICAVLDSIALMIIGVPLPLLWGLLAFMTNYIPNIGFFIGLIPPLLLGLLSGNIWTAIWVIIAYCAINFVIQSLIQPRFLGNAVGLTVTVTFLALTFWAWALGPLGALLAIPLTLLVKAILIDIDPATKWVDAVIGPLPSSPAK